jgi:hypothetical protein
MPVTWLAYTAVLVALLPCATLFGQSTPPMARLGTFHIQGLIRTYYDSAVPNGKVTFEGDKFTKTVFADNTGFYEADLALGSYTMTAENEYMSPDPLFVPFGTAAQDPRLRNLQLYERPLFRIASPTSVTLNVTLDPPNPNCEPGYGVGPSASAPAPDRGEIVCGGRDRFPIPSNDDIPFELFIRFRTRRNSDTGFVYNTGRDLPGWTTPVFVAYNLFTLQADHVAYNLETRTLQATGNVVVVSAGGETQKAGSLTFKIENGQAARLH